MDDSQVKIRLPREVKDWLKHQAITNRRTLSNEIAHRMTKDYEEAAKEEGAHAKEHA